MKYAPHAPDATVIIGGWHSRCNNCGKECNFHSKTHDVILGYGDDNGMPGCGIEWTHVLQEYGGGNSHRPDLEIVTWE